MNSRSLTPIELIAAVSKHLEGANYSRIEDTELGAVDTGRGRFYEDEYGVVLVVVYETWAELAGGWSDDQSRLVELMSAHMTRSDPKAWEGYLVLLSPASPPPDDEGMVEQIRYNTTRVRKLIATGSELASLSEIERTILPLLPVVPPAGLEPETSALDLLPDLLAKQGIEHADSKAVIAAFRDQRPLVEALQRIEEEL